MNIKKVKVYIDGYCKGNPGKGGALAVFEIKSGNTFRRDETYEQTTNNRAEYGALLLALNEIYEEIDWLENSEIDTKLDVLVYTDSNLIVGHLNKGWKVNKNHDLVNEAKVLLEKIRKNHTINIDWIPRDENKAGVKLENDT